MGQRVTALASKDPRFKVVAALESANHPLLGKDAGLIAGVGEIGVPLGVVGESDADVVIDFSVPDAAVAVVAHCVEFKRPLVIATTGLDAEQQEYIRKAAKKIPIVWSPSMSTAVNVAMKLTEIAAEALRDLPTGVDVEIIERHHRFKEDSPSGTALRFGKIVADAMGQTEHTSTAAQAAPANAPATRSATTPSAPATTRASTRSSSACSAKRSNSASPPSNRDCYAQGALLAAEWLVGKPPGLYCMNDVLGL